MVYKNTRLSSPERLPALSLINITTILNVLEIQQVTEITDCQVVTNLHCLFEMMVLWNNGKMGIKTENKIFDYPKFL